jgi:hypothetical protein
MPNFLIDEDTDLLAGEFVLGTLDSEERASAQPLLRTDHGFIAMVRIWERRFGELHLMVEPVEPDTKILQRIKKKLAETPQGGQAADGKPPAEMTPSRQMPESTALSASAETPKPAGDSAGGETSKPEEVPADGTMPKPAEVPANAETAKPADIPPAPDPVIGTAAEIQPSPESRPPEAVVRSEHGPIAKAAIPAPTIDVIRSRSRWRALGVCMTLLVVGFAALLTAWRFVPDRLPAELRPSELMMSIGIQSNPRAAPAVGPAPPESQFDE